MKKPPFKADNPDQAMQNFNDALRKVISVSKDDLEKDAGFKATIRTVRGTRKKAKEARANERRTKGL
jgi:hypothetical protein